MYFFGTLHDSGFDLHKWKRETCISPEEIGRWKCGLCGDNPVRHTKRAVSGQKELRLSG